MERKVQRQRFAQQMHHPAVIEAEKKRNEHFLALHDLLPMTLPMTTEMDGGTEALQRFCCDQPAGLPIEIMRARPYGQAEPPEIIALEEVLMP
ncbi:hypothetical protein [Pseudomonas tohonis]|uniref:hypothetical protein n=1 Tax=Pseudomonas tohonis TaxID=2725477 RepID=UPI001F2F4C97|nr:hypothetical protein [Pseudomonas tohonis]